MGEIVEAAQAVNTNPHTTKLKNDALHEQFIKAGYLIEIPSGKVTRRVSTPLGREKGVITEKVKLDNGMTVSVVKYSPELQKEFIDYLTSEEYRSKIGCLEQPLTEKTDAPAEKEPDSAEPDDAEDLQPEGAEYSASDFTHLIGVSVDAPNSQEDSICRLAVSYYSDGEPVTVSWLINPEADFERSKMSRHGITPEMVSSAPTLAQLWPEIEPMFRGSLLVAHRAASVFPVLMKALNNYSLRLPDTFYVSTGSLDKRYSQQRSRHGFGRVCEEYGIPLDLHDAESRSRAFLELFSRLEKDGVPVYSLVKPL